MNLDRMRQSWKENDDRRDKDNVFPKDVIKYSDLSYGSKNKWNLFDIYIPDTKLEKYPVILSIHGGGWFYGDKELYRFYTANLALNGFAVINMNYSLVPESKYPTPIYEIFKCIDYLVTIKDKYNLDMDNFFMVGDSAGAQLCHQVSTIISNDEYRKLFNIELNKGFKLKGIALNCGVYSFGIGPLGPLAVVKEYMPNDWKKYKETLDVKKYMTSNFPKTYIMSGCNDPLRIFLKPMTKRLNKLGIENVSKLYGIKGKDFCPHVFHVDMNNKIGKLANTDECNFFKKLIN